MQIHITIQRPLLTMTILVAAVLWFSGTVTIGFGSANGTGGRLNGAMAAQAQQDVDRERLKREVLAQREEILRYQLAMLEDEAMRNVSDPAKLNSVIENREVLLALISERDQSETLLKKSLEQLWEAQGTVFTNATPGSIRLSWPVPPLLGISAHFEDDGYLARFGVQHHAIDIPTAENTEITAPADGTVTQVSLNGLGYSYLVLSHAGGFETVYGHITSSLVQEGDTVRKGQPIATSGGRPGSIGSGLMTTGEHLHFAVKKDGVLVDPMGYMED